MTLQLEHERAFNAFAASRELEPGSSNYIVDAATGLLSRATVWVHGDVWFVDHYERNHTHYWDEYLRAARRPQTYWRR